MKKEINVHPRQITDTTYSISCCTPCSALTSTGSPTVAICTGTCTGSFTECPSILTCQSTGCNSKRKHRIAHTALQWLGIKSIHHQWVNYECTSQSLLSRSDLPMRKRENQLILCRQQVATYETHNALTPTVRPAEATFTITSTSKSNWVDYKHRLWSNIPKKPRHPQITTTRSLMCIIS